MNSKIKVILEYIFLRLRIMVLAVARRKVFPSFFTAIRNFPKINGKKIQAKFVRNRLSRADEQRNRVHDTAAYVPAISKVECDDTESKHVFAQHNKVVYRVANEQRNTDGFRRLFLASAACTLATLYAPGDFVYH